MAQIPNKGPATPAPKVSLKQYDSLDEVEGVTRAGAYSEAMATLESQLVKGKFYAGANIIQIVAQTTKKDPKAVRGAMWGYFNKHKTTWKKTTKKGVFQFNG